MGVKVKRGTDGVFECRLYLGRGIDGKAIRPYKRFPNAATEEEAQALAETWAAYVTADGTVRSARLTDLLEDYVQLRERNGASPNSIKSYRLFCRYVARYLKTANARDLGVMDFNRFEQRLLMAKDEGGQGLCRNSVINIHNFLRGAYNHFVDAGICDANPLAYVAKPSPERHEASALTEWDFEGLNGKLEGALSKEIVTKADFRAAVYAFASWLSLVTGMRVGEVCAVQRIDVKRALSYVHVGGNVIEGKGKKPYRRNVTKGRKCRNIALTQDDIAVIDAFTKLQSDVLGRLGADCPLGDARRLLHAPNDDFTGFQTHTRLVRTAEGDNFPQPEAHARLVAHRQRLRPEDAIGAHGARGRGDDASDIRAPYARTRPGGGAALQRGEAPRFEWIRGRDYA